MKLVKRMTPIAAALVTLAIVGAVGFFAVHQLKVEARQIVTDTLPGLSYGGQINAGLSDNFIKTLLAIHADDPAERTTYLGRPAAGSGGAPRAGSGCRQRASPARPEWTPTGVGCAPSAPFRA